MFSWLFGKKNKPTNRDAGAPGFLCSACFAVRPGAELRALPWWNAGQRAFFMTNRCGDCFPRSLDETKARLAAWDEEAEAAFTSFLDIWKIRDHLPALVAPSVHESAQRIVAEVESSHGKALAPLVLGRR